MPRRGWSVFEPSDGWIKILRRPRPPAEQWPCAEADHSQPRVEGSLEERCAKHVEDSKQKLQKLEADLASLGPEDIGARAELEAALTRARAQSKPKPRVSMSPDVAIDEAKLKVTRLEKALEALGNSSGTEVDCLQRALAKARQAARERPLEVQIKECREFISRAEHRVAKLEADVVAEKTMLEEGRARLSRSSSRRVLFRFTHQVGWRDAFRAAAIPSKKRSPVTPRLPQSSHSMC